MSASDEADIRRLSRHRSGIAVRFPLIVRWHTDKSPADADRIEAITALLQDNPPTA